MILRKLNEMQENMDVQFKDSRKTMHSMKKKFNQNIEIIKKNPSEMLDS